MNRAKKRRVKLRSPTNKFTKIKFHFLASRRLITIPIRMHKLKQLFLTLNDWFYFHDLLLVCGHFPPKTNCILNRELKRCLGRRRQEFWFRNDHREFYVSSMLLTFFRWRCARVLLSSIPCRLFASSAATTQLSKR